MKILVLGQDGHGKTTFADLLAKHSTLRVEDSSWFAMEKAVLPYFGKWYANKEDCFKDRGNNRNIWKALIAYYNTPDKARLAKELLEVADVYVGMRCPLEYEASKHLFDLIVYCDGSDRTGYTEGSLTIPYDEDCMAKISTNGTEKQLEEKVLTFIQVTKVMGKNRENNKL